jgi:hypothetical protein
MGLRMTASAVVKSLPEALEPGAAPYQRDGEIPRPGLWPMIITDAVRSGIRAAAG